MENLSPRLISSALALVYLSLSSTLHAQAASDRFWIEGGVYFPQVDSSVAVNSKVNAGVGTDIDMEDDLGFDDSATLAAIQAGWRISRKFSVVAEYFSLGRDTTHTTTRSITFDGATYPVSTSLTSEFKSDVYRLYLGYSFVRNDKADLGVALGLHATDFGVSLEGQGRVGGNAGATLQRRAQDFLAPMPTVGLYGSYEVMPRLTLGARADYLSLSVGDYDGELINLQAKVTYRVFENIGIGAAWRYVDYRVDVDKDRYAGRFEYEFNGPSLFLQAGF